MAEIKNQETGGWEKRIKTKGSTLSKKLTKLTLNKDGYEPKRQNRFIVEHSEVDIPAWALRRTTRPTWVFDEGWGDIKMEYLDTIAPSISDVIFHGLIENRDKLPKICTIEIKSLGPVGDLVEKWVIEGRYKSVDFSDSSYDSDELQKVTIIFEPIRCILAF